MIYSYSEEADEDLDRIYDFGLQTFGKNQADIYYFGLLDQFEKIANNPKLYTTLDDFRSYRRCVYESHSIYYTEQEQGVLIIPILGQEDTNKAFHN